MNEDQQWLKSAAQLLTGAWPGASSGFTRRSHGHSIREKKQSEPPDPRYPIPTSLYLIYMKFVEDGLLVRHFEDKYIGTAETMDLPGSEWALIEQARASGPTLPPNNFEGIQWDKPCWFTIIIDNVGWRFHEGQSAAYHHDPFIFISHKNILTVDAPGSVDKFYDPNYSFYDAQTFTTAHYETDPNDAVAGVRCINYFKSDAQGTPIGSGQYKDYSFEIYLEAPFSASMGQKTITILIDPDGQNEGPP